MTIKRDLLKAFLLNVLKGFDANYTVEDRLRIATLKQESRAERIAIMGEDLTYAEIHASRIEYPEGGRSSGSTSRTRDHIYEVHVWRKFEDADTYAASSQSKWDTIVGDDGGVLESLANEPYFQDAGNTYVISRPVNVSLTNDLIDNNPIELAHYLTFRITIKG